LISDYNLITWFSPGTPGFLHKLVNGGKDVGINLKVSKASKMIAEIDENGEWTFSYIHE
jgi:hypothetical protein